MTQKDGSKYPQGHFNSKPCRQCDRPFVPDAPSRLYCSTQCSEIAYDDAYYRRTYGVGYEAVDALRQEQGSVCAICLGPGFKMRGHHRQTLAVDHCHSTGMVRGLLCHNCNRALGLLKDDPTVVQRAVAYLLKHQEGATTIPEGSRAKQPEAHGP